MTTSIGVSSGSINSARGAGGRTTVRGAGATAAHPATSARCATAEATTVAGRARTSGWIVIQAAALHARQLAAGGSAC